MRINPEACKVCSHSQSEKLGYQSNIWLTCYCRDSSEDAFYAKWKFWPPPMHVVMWQDDPGQTPIKYTYNLSFKVPDRCPYILEHTVSE